MTDYLPKDATIEQACNWLQAKTGETWILPRLIESGLRPYVWLGNDPAHPYLFENRPAGYQVQVMFQDDLTRLEADGTCTLTMYETPDGKLVKRVPSGVVPLTELTFKREDIHGLAVQTAPAQNTAKPAPVADSDALPDPERRLALLRALGGDAKYSRGDWTFKGISALVASEKGRKRSTEKTIREDLKEAAQKERDAGRAGFATGLGQR